jgi:hypothetical protein
LSRESTRRPDRVPAQYQDAQPLNLPLATVTVEELLERQADGWPSSDVQVSAEGRDVPEAEAIAADLDARLFPELPEEDRELGGPGGSGIDLALSRRRSHRTPAKRKLTSAARV